MDECESVQLLIRKERRREGGKGGGAAVETEGLFVWFFWLRSEELAKREERTQKSPKKTSVLENEGKSRFDPEAGGWIGS